MNDEKFKNPKRLIAHEEEYQDTYYRVLEGEQTEKSTENLLEEIMADNISNLKIEMDIQTQEA